MADPFYRVFETREFISELARLDPSIRKMLERKLKEYVYPQLRREPHAGLNIKKLKDWNPETWRYRVGPWRFFYEIHEPGKKVYLTALDHRKEAYR